MKFLRSEIEGPIWDREINGNIRKDIAHKQTLTHVYKLTEN